MKQSDGPSRGFEGRGNHQHNTSLHFFFVFLTILCSTRLILKVGFNHRIEEASHLQTTVRCSAPSEQNNVRQKFAVGKEPMEGKKDKSRSFFSQEPPAVAEATACLDLKWGRQFRSLKS